MNRLFFENSKSWRNWLKENCDKEKEVWLIFYKKNSGKPTIDYESAVEEALCYGWIDSIIKRSDDEKYVRKFTPRNDNSKWSELNKKRVEYLISSKRMTKFGLTKVQVAKRNGQWDKPDRPNLTFEMPEIFQTALNQNKKAKDYFNTLPKSQQKLYLGWIVTAKRQETKDKRVKEAINLLEKKEKLGLK